MCTVAIEKQRSSNSSLSLHNFLGFTLWAELRSARFNYNSPSIWTLITTLMWALSFTWDHKHELPFKLMSKTVFVTEIYTERCLLFIGLPTIVPSFDGRFPAIACHNTSTVSIIPDCDLFYRDWLIVRVSEGVCVSLPLIYFYKSLLYLIHNFLSYSANFLQSFLKLLLRVLKFHNFFYFLKETTRGNLFFYVWLFGHPWLPRNPVQNYAYVIAIYGCCSI